MAAISVSAHCIKSSAVSGLSEIEAKDYSFTSLTKRLGPAVILPDYRPPRSMKGEIL